jgi:aspartate/methionine/tyrosine aminotransferase
MPGFVLEHWVDAALRSIGQFPSAGLKQVRARVSENGGEVAKLLKLLDLERTDYDTIPFAWAKIEHRRRSTTAANLLYRRSRILVAPGKGFGDAGDGYLRFSLLVDPANYGEAFERVQKKLRFLKLSEAE